MSAGAEVGAEDHSDLENICTTLESQNVHFELRLSFLFHRKSADLSDSSAATGGPSGGHLLPDGPVSIYVWWSEYDQRLGLDALKRDG